MSYAVYDGDSRSAWERLDWVSRRSDDGRTPSVAQGKDEVQDLRRIAREVEFLIVESKELKQSHRSYDPVWARIGYVVIFGFAIAILGVLLRFAVSGPLPYALAALGMGFVVAALYHGSVISRSNGLDR